MLTLQQQSPVRGFTLESNGDMSDLEVTVMSCRVSVSIKNLIKHDTREMMKL